MLHNPNYSQTARITRFGRGGTLLRSRNPQQPLTVEEIQARAPSIFADDKHSSRSKRYTFIPTAGLLNGMIKAGFQPCEVRQGGSGDEEKRGFTKHMIRFRRTEDFETQLRKVGDSVQEVVLINSHDGTSSYQLHQGWFRLVCLNGLIVADSTRDNFGIKVPHKGDILGQVIDAAYTVIESGKQQIESIKEMQALALSPPEQRAFAHAAGQLRFEPEGKIEVEADAINRARRTADVGNSLWLTLNRTQENLLQGGLHYVGQRKRPDGNIMRTHSQTRPVNGIDGNVTLNRALWTLAEEMRRLKAA